MMQTNTLPGGDLRVAMLELITDRLEPGVELTVDSTLDELDLDSLDLIELAQAIDDEFGILLEAADVRQAQTLGDILDAAMANR